MAMYQRISLQLAVSSSPLIDTAIARTEKYSTRDVIDSQDGPTGENPNLTSGTGRARTRRYV
jgi:hypothetical protein